MKPAIFDYVRPETLEEALRLLDDAPEDTVLLAGGQSLVPLLNMRLARPELVIDLNRLDELTTLSVEAEAVRIGAMVRQRDVETDAALRASTPLLAEALGHVAHVAIRMRGTVCGSLAHADPAAELPAVMTALDARVVLASSSRGTREVPAREFFHGPYWTALEKGELIAAVTFTPPPPGTGWSFVEVARTHGAFALVGAGALVRLAQDGSIDHIDLALCGVGGTPHRPSWLHESALERAPSPELFKELGDRIAEEVDPIGNGHGSADYRRAITPEVVKRSLVRACSRSDRQPAETQR